MYGISVITSDGFTPRPGDNGHVAERFMTWLTRWVHRAVAYFRAAEGRPALAGASNVADVAIAALAMVLALIAVLDDNNGGGPRRSRGPGAEPRRASGAGTRRR